MIPRFRRVARSFKTLFLSTGVLLAGGTAAWVANTSPPPAPASAPAPADGTEKVTRVGANGLRVPAAVARRMGLKTAVVERATRPLPLPPFQGRLALDNNTLQRVHSRFAGEVVELGTTTEPAEVNVTSRPTTVRTRPLRAWDRVEAGQLLAVVWSKDLGEKKSELIDAVSKWTTDEQTLTRLKDLYAQNGTPERSVRDAERVVQADHIAIERIERTLESWRLTPAEIAAVRAEAGSEPRGAKRPDAAAWARVEVRATAPGWIQEKNVNRGDLVTTDTDLYKVADLSSLTVWAHVYEDDLPLLNGLPKPIPWVVTLPSRPGVRFPGTLENVASVIDPNQQTALVTGTVANPRGELKVGQLVAVHISRPPPRGELALPTDAVTEDGVRGAAFVVGPDGTYTRCPVTVLRRSREVVHVKARESLKAGDRVVTAGALLLRDALEALPPVKP